MISVTSTSALLFDSSPHNDDTTAVLVPELGYEEKAFPPHVVQRGRGPSRHVREEVLHLHQQHKHHRRHHTLLGVDNL
jgi:hypothetical protein